ncbi:WecB/TagA/CpsF family glycosyltransferase [Methylobacterium sp. Leaf118]|uniref:WecB/TagA/CpsF family glycosyltransferase n=1 Tax=Methylobacterium sp. Leaf118 TaxID=2876562 RepID=UPI001E34797F|nr:WecB/TagA/CpsF family glycosyltransferase [Methylobacterium sp. Leaf118]
MRLADEPLDRPDHGTRRAVPKPVPDFSRSAFCIFGVTLDNVAMDEVLRVIREAVRTRRKLTIATPNLNFVVRAASDPAFHASILRSDLSLVDGMPLVWAGRWFGVPVKGRVTGADLFERLRRSRDPAERLNVYLFGGPDGVARLAADRLNAEGGGLRCVGYRSPGYGSVEAISHPEIIREINASGADFLLVALGAEKGQSWIERNREALEVPVVSHLGAVINFTAGTVRRAPARLQRAGLEWAWRIYREPALWRRYLSDGSAALAMLARTSWNAGMARLPSPRGSRAFPSAVEVVEDERDAVIRMKGNWRAPGLGPLRDTLQAQAGSDKRLSIDFGGTTGLDSAAVAVLMLLRQARLDAGRGWHVTGASSRLSRLCRSYGADDLIG